MWWEPSGPNCGNIKRRARVMRTPILQIIGQVSSGSSLVHHVSRCAKSKSRKRPFRLRLADSRYLDHPRFATRPTPSLIVISWLAEILLKLSCDPLGQYTSTSTELTFPRPK